MKRRLMNLNYSDGLVFYAPCDSTTVKDLVTGTILQSDATFKRINDNPFNGYCLTKSTSGNGCYYFEPAFDLAKGNYTICGWFKSTTCENGGLRAKTDTKAGRNCRYGFNAAQNEGRAGWLLPNNWGTYMGSDSYATNKWLYYEMTKAGDTYTMFIHGVKIGSKTYSGSTSPGNLFCIMGQYGQYFCHVFIYNKVLHTANFIPPTKPY